MLRLVLIPLLAGLAVTILVYLYLGRETVETIAPGEGVQVVAAKVAIPAKSVVRAEQLTTRVLPKEMAGIGEFTDAKNVVGKTTSAAIAVGEPVLSAKLAPEGKTGPLAYRVPKLHRAYTVKVDEFTGVAGHVQVGDRVDILLTVPSQEKKNWPLESRIVMENIEVLAKGMPGAENAGLTSYTLAIEAKFVADLVLAETIGPLKLVLRPATEEANLGQVRVFEERFHTWQTGR